MYWNIWTRIHLPLHLWEILITAKQEEHLVLANWNKLRNLKNNIRQISNKVNHFKSCHIYTCPTKSIWEWLCTSQKHYLLDTLNVIKVSFKVNLIQFMLTKWLIASASGILITKWVGSACVKFVWTLKIKKKI